jgi:hypothetical protein
MSIMLTLPNNFPFLSIIMPCTSFFPPAAICLPPS